MPDASPASTSAAAPKRREAAIGIGWLRMTGWRAQAIQAVIFGALGALVAFRVAQRVQQRGWSQMIGNAWPLYASVSLWIAFSIYWGVAARSESAVRSAESKGSRAFHLLLINGSMLLIYISLPGLGGRFLPATPIVHVVGIAVQATFFLFAVWARRTLGRHWSGDVTVKVDHELIRTGP
jgi:protein-S-isoprenylcysteine O-methyltransferase Ste14